MPKCVPQLPPSAWEECTKEDLEYACATFQKGNRLDAHMLAAESLVQLSEAAKCKVFCAKTILNPNSELLSTLLSLIQSSRMSEKVRAFGDDEVSDMEQEHFRLMHRHALVVLANCLDAVRESGELQARLADLPELSSDNTVNALVGDLSCAKAKPHDAAAACRCLRALCSLDECKNKLVRMGGKPVLSAAKHQSSHALLEAEASKLMQDL